MTKQSTIARIDDCVDATTQGLEKYSKRIKTIIVIST